MNLRQFYDSLSVAEIERFVTDHQEEHLSLDFKTGGEYLTSGSDKKGFAELLSGFSNSAGGIVIWGIATAKDRAGRDVASELKPIPNVARFAARLNEFTPLSLHPTNDRVLHRYFDLADMSGYAATLVPESEVGPHMALAGHHRYFKRAGDRFYRMEHFDVADMFGRRQRAVLKLHHRMTGGVRVQGYQGTKRDARLHVSLANEGRASAVAPFVTISVSAPFHVDRAGASSRAHGDAKFEVFPDGSRNMSLIAGVDVLLHPKAEVPIVEVIAEIWDHETVPLCVIKYALAAKDLPLVEDSIELDSENIARGMRRPVEAKSEGEMHPTA